MVFQLAGGSRDHYTSRAKIIMFGITDLLSCDRQADGILVLRTIRYRERLINEREN